MTTINLKEFYPWYDHAEYIEVPDEVAEELKADKRYEQAYIRKVMRNKAQYSLDCDDGIEYSACVFEKSPEELVIMKEQYQMLCRALNSLPEIQGRRVDANIIMGKTLREIAKEENVGKSSVGGSVKIGLASMKKYLQENW